MTLQQLRYLIAVAECGSINAAAGDLYTSQSNVSAAVSELERDTPLAARPLSACNNTTESQPPDRATQTRIGSPDAVRRAAKKPATTVGRSLAVDGFAACSVAAAIGLRGGLSIGHQILSARSASGCSSPENWFQSGFGARRILAQTDRPTVRRS